MKRIMTTEGTGQCSRRRQTRPWEDMIR